MGEKDDDSAAQLARDRFPRFSALALGFTPISVALAGAGPLLAGRLASARLKYGSATTLLC